MSWGTTCPRGISRSFGHLKAVGFHSVFIVDIGAHRGDRTRLALDVFPESKFLLIEPLQEMRVQLDALCQEHPNVRRVECAAGPEKGEMPLNIISEDLMGSSLLPMGSEAVRRMVKIETIDSLLNGTLPDIVKLDVQGFEIEALKGAENLFGKTELFIVETSFFDFF